MFAVAVLLTAAVPVYQDAAAPPAPSPWMAGLGELLPVGRTSP